MKAYISLLIAICGLTKALIRQHFFINMTKNWEDAQSFCRTYYEDLSTITSRNEEHLVLSLTDYSKLKWIGLHKDMTGTDGWLWPNEKSVSFTDWATDQPDNQNGIQFCVAIIYRWFDYFCDVALPFFCSKTRFILVKENKTWEEALQYCRTQYSDLASMTTDRQLQLAKQVAVGYQTESVWTGLRFLVGEWFWVNNEPMWDQISLPECPAQPGRCGARNIKTDKWENRNCAEKLNFLCN